MKSAVTRGIMRGMRQTDIPSLATRWTLDPDVDFLNHGSFGACPRAVLDAQAALRARMERQPVQFLVRDLWGLQDAARHAVADFVDAEPGGLAFVRNASQGISTVLRGLRLAAGDEVLLLDHAYPAVRNAALFVTRAVGARVVEAPVPFPGTTIEDLVAAVLGAVTDRTRLCILDHVTSPTGLVVPVEILVPALHARGVDVLVDGAHAPGQVDVSVRRLDPAWYVANLHKWVCAPKGAAFLWTRADRREGLHPATISHGYGMCSDEKSKYRLEFDWTGTDDPTPALSVAAALEAMGSMLPGGWPAVRAHNRALALRGRELLCAALGVPAPTTDDLVGAMAAVPLPPADEVCDAFHTSPLQMALAQQGFEVPVVSWPAAPHRLLRISAQLYNHEAQYARLATVLGRVLGRG